jgi:hypothetical protein
MAQERSSLGLSRHLRKKKIPHRSPSIEKVLAWAVQAINAPIKDGPMHLLIGNRVPLLVHKCESHSQCQIRV